MSAGRHVNKTAIHVRLAEADITDLLNGQRTIETLLDVLADPAACYRQADDDTKKDFIHVCFKKIWIDTHPDTATPTVADHEPHPLLPPHLPVPDTKKRRPHQK